MNKIEVGNAPSPNLKKVASKIGSMENAQHKPGRFLKSFSNILCPNKFLFIDPGGGQIKIESKKLEFKAGSRIEAKNESYVPRGGDKKVRFRHIYE